MPLASHTSLVRHLSIASADAITPLPVYGNLQRLERALDRAVLAEAAVQRDEHAIEAVALQLPQVALGGIERMRIDTLLAQRAQHAVAGHERNLALRRRSAQQHGHLAELRTAHLASPTIRTSGSSSTPVLRAHRFAHVADQRLDVRGARAPAGIHDEIRVLLRHARAADRVALEAARLDEPRRVVARRIAEHAAGVGQRQRLRRDALAPAVP